MLVPEGQRTFLGRKSWVAYAITALRHVVLLLGVAVLWQFATTFVSIVALLLVLGHLAYRILDLRSCELFLTNDGVWVFSGILPWTKGMRGVKWRDLYEATFFNTMLSWATKSY